MEPVDAVLLYWDKQRSEMRISIGVSGLVMELDSLIGWEREPAAQMVWHGSQVSQELMQIAMGIVGSGDVHHCENQSEIAVKQSCALPWCSCSWLCFRPRDHERNAARHDWHTGMYENSTGAQVPVSRVIQIATPSGLMEAPMQEVEVEVQRSSGISAAMRPAAALTSTVVASYLVQRRIQALRKKSPAPKQLYDVKQRKVVSLGQDEVEYIAVSYVWDQFSDSDLRAAIWHSDLLGLFRYFWVDRWCIDGNISGKIH